MNKAIAAAIINRKGLAELNANNNGNVSWANINSSKSVWSIDIPAKKFLSDSHVLLNDRGNNVFYWIDIPRGTFPAPYNTFRKLRDGYISVELSSKDTNKFVDVKSGGSEFDFKKLNITAIRYEGTSDEGIIPPANDHNDIPPRFQSKTMIRPSLSGHLNSEAFSSLEEGMQ